MCVHFQLEPQLGGLSRMECGLGRTLKWIDSRLSQVFWTLLYPSLSDSYAS